MRKYYDFSWALKQMKAGKNVTRMAWTGESIGICDPQNVTAILHFQVSKGTQVGPWIPHHQDILSDDWFAV